MLISFIIVAYNSENEIGDILSDLNSQDFDRKCIEVILIDSKSIDETKSRMEEFKDKHINQYFNIVVKDNEKRILPAGWNIALHNATGDLIIRVDAHIRIDRTFISKNVDNILKGENISGGKVVSINDSENIVGKVLKITDNSIFAGGVADFRRASHACYMRSLPFAAYRKEVFKNIGYYDERFYRTEDNEMHYRMRKHGYKLFFDPNIITYRKSRKSLKALLKQKYSNGFCIGTTLLINPRSYSITHLVPLAFVLTILVFVFLSGWYPELLIALAIIYFTVNLFFSIKEITDNKLKMRLIIMISGIFFLIHIFYGMGTVNGLLKYIVGKKRNA